MRWGCPGWGSRSDSLFTGLVAPPMFPCFSCSPLRQNSDQRPQLSLPALPQIPQDSQGPQPCPTLLGDLLVQRKDQNAGEGAAPLGGWVLLS